jgi:trk/ktr system potassium uptake protein
MFVLVVGGGKVGYYLTKELVAAGHEIVLMEKDAARAAQIADEIGSIVLPHDGCEGRYLAAAGCNRADVVAAVTGDDEDNLVICQMAKHHFDVPRTIARVNNPKNEDLFRHLGVDEIISPTRVILGSIEQDIPVHELLHLAALGESDLEIIEAQLQPASPAVGRSPRDLAIPATCSLFAVVRDGEAAPLSADTVLRAGDKVIAIGRSECEARLRDELLGDPATGVESNEDLQTSRLAARPAPLRADEARGVREAVGSRGGTRLGSGSNGRPDDAAR